MDFPSSYGWFASARVGCFDLEPHTCNQAFWQSMKHISMRVLRLPVSTSKHILSTFRSTPGCVEMPSSRLMIIPINSPMLRPPSGCISLHQTTSQESHAHAFGSSVQPAVKSLAPGLRLGSQFGWWKIGLRGRDVTIRVGVENAAPSSCGEGSVSWQGIWLKLWKIKYQITSQYMQTISTEITTLS